MKDVFKETTIKPKKEHKDDNIGFRLSKDKKEKVNLILDTLNKELGTNLNYSYLADNLIANFNNNPVINLHMKKEDLLNKVDLAKKEIEILENLIKNYLEEVETIDEKINKFDVAGVPQFTENNQLNRALNHMSILIKERNITEFESIPNELYIATFNTFGINVNVLKEAVKKNFELLLK